MIVAVEESAENRPKAIWSPWGEYDGRVSCSAPGKVSCWSPLPSGFTVSIACSSELQQCVEKASFEPSGAQSASTASSAVGVIR
jgi:hypothetical protein